MIHFFFFFAFVALRALCGYGSGENSPVPVHEAHALGAHVAVGGEDPSGGAPPLAARRSKAVHGAHALLGASHILASEYLHRSQAVQSVKFALIYDFCIGKSSVFCP